MAVFLDLERNGPAALNHVPEPVQRSDSRVPGPGEDQLAGAARPDQLVVDDVRRHPDQREVLAALPDDLVTCRVRDQVGEALHSDGVAVVNRGGHRLGQRQDLSHAVLHLLTATLALLAAVPEPYR